MIPKINWSRSHEKENPFGGVGGFRELRITFHSGSFANPASDEAKALEMLYGLANLDDIDALSFNGEFFPKVEFEPILEEKDYVGIRVLDKDNNILRYNGVPTSSVDKNAILHVTGSYSKNETERNETIQQNLLAAETNSSLQRDIFITLSSMLLEHRNTLDDCNIFTPLEALKLVGLYLRTRNEFEWISEVKGNTSFSTKRHSFYQILTRGMLPSSWKYISSLGQHSKREELVQLGWSIIERFSRVLQARDEIARLFYMPDTSSSEEQKLYHFDYLTLLLTATLDVQALVINKVYGFGLSASDCGFTRKRFKNAIKNNTSSKSLDAVIVANSDFIAILHELRNKIHSVSLDTNVYVPDTSSDKLLEAIYQFAPHNHWGVEKNKVTLIKNNNSPVSSYKYSTDIYILACSLVAETCKLINSLMDETRIEKFLDEPRLSKIKVEPPAEMSSHIQAYLMLA